MTRVFRRAVIGAVCFAFVTAGFSAGMMPHQAHATPTPQSFAPLVETLSPAVVNIYTAQKITRSQTQAFGFPDDPQLEPFRQFFEQFGAPGMPPQQDRGEQEVTSLGSGFIIDASGYIVTNAHVIADADEISVKLHDNSELSATVVGKDTKTDLALLKVEPKKPLPAVRFGNSDASRVGDWVIAIGNPFGLGGTVTAGIISARSRSINAGPFDDFIQTDAAINRGNSGGPMFNLQGEVIGINTAIFSPSGGSIGIGFAVPSSLAQPVLAQLREFGRTHRGWLGVKIQEVSKEIAESLELKRPQGALVLELTDDSPAKKAGVQSGDVILSFNGKPVEEMRFLPRLVAEAPIGKAVPMEIWRSGKQKTLSVTIGELKEEDEQAATTPAKNKNTPAVANGETVLGMRLAPINPALRKRYDIAADVEGLVVLDIERTSPALRRGLRVGDVLVQLHQQPLKSVADFRDALNEAKKDGRKHALLRLIRGAEAVFVPLPTSAEE